MSIHSTWSSCDNFGQLGILFFFVIIYVFNPSLLKSTIEKRVN